MCFVDGLFLFVRCVWILEQSQKIPLKSYQRRMNESPVSRLEKSRLQFNTSVARIFLHCIDHNQKERHESRVSFALRINFTSLERRKKGSLNSFSSSKTTVQDGKDSVTSFMTAPLDFTRLVFFSLKSSFIQVDKKGNNCTQCSVRKLSKMSHQNWPSG